MTTPGDDKDTSNHNFSGFVVPWLDLSKFGVSRSDLGLPALDQFNLSWAAVQPLLRTLRGANTIADALFYDVSLLWLRLYTRGVLLSTNPMTPAAAARNSILALQAATKFVNLSAFANPEGAILVIDAHHAPFVQKFDDVTTFLNEGKKFPTPADAAQLGETPREVKIITVTGVGSSALGSAAFGWNVSEALRRPVAAIVPGYGLADIIPQALGGWFGFGGYDFMRRMLQRTGNQLFPEMAAVGHRLAETSPGATARQAAGAEFRSGSPESDVLHDILEQNPKITRLYGHSKGALCIANAIRGLPSERYADLHVTTFGCVIEEETDADYNQILGEIDGLGQLNSWGNWPERWINSWHSTNSFLPRTMPVADLVNKDVRDEDPVYVNPEQLKKALQEALKALPAH